MDQTHNAASSTTNQTDVSVHGSTILVSLQDPMAALKTLGSVVKRNCDMAAWVVDLVTSLTANVEKSATTKDQPIDKSEQKINDTASSLNDALCVANNWAGQESLACLGGWDDDEPKSRRLEQLANPLKRRKKLWTLSCCQDSKLKTQPRGESRRQTDSSVAWVILTNTAAYQTL